MKPTEPEYLIINAELLAPDGGTRPASVSIVGNKIRSVSEPPSTRALTIIDAKGGLLIPGLYDHHTHLLSYAAALASVRCGPPEVETESELIRALQQPGKGWLRGTAFHESVVPGFDRAWLDANGPPRPIRIQHRSGRLWVLNSLALAQIEDAASQLPAHERGKLTSPDGRLYDVDELLGALTRSHMPPVALASEQLAAFGVTAINDMTPANDAETWLWFNRLQRAGELAQKVRMSGRPCLSSHTDKPHLSVGETKVHLHDSSLPDFPVFVDMIRNSHANNRGVAVHCVTEVELVFTLSAFRAAGPRPGDRIEHASVVPPTLIEQLKELGLGVVTQPNFIAERGDVYLSEIPQGEHSLLYRVKSLIDAGIPLAFGTDLPFGNPDPWAAMSAATTRTTRAGRCLGHDERVAPEEAINRFLGALDDPFTPRAVLPGAPADLCLLDVPWRIARANLSSSHVRMTIRDGEVIYSNRGQCTYFPGAAGNPI